LGVTDGFASLGKMRSDMVKNAEAYASMTCCQGLSGLYEDLIEK